MGKIVSGSASIPSRPGKMPNSLRAGFFLRAVTEVRGSQSGTEGYSLAEMNLIS